MVLIDTSPLFALHDDDIFIARSKLLTEAFTCI